MQRYAKFRPFLFGLALGLACVWFYDRMISARESVHVDLPLAASSDVFYIYRKDERFLPIGGGSHCCLPNMSIIESDKPIKNHLRFTLHNQYFYQTIPLDHEKEFVNVKRRPDGSYDIAPYFIECLDNAWTAPKEFVPETPNHSEFHTLELNHDIKFTVKKPSVKGECQIYVGTANSLEKVRALLTESQAIRHPLTAKAIDRLFSRRERFINK